MDSETLLLLVGLGGILALDGTALGQFMISRPLVAGALAGWILGSPGTGLLVGSVLEIYLIPVFPVGGSRFPEGGPASVVAVAAAVALPGAGGLALGTVLGLVWSQVGAGSIGAVRSLNGRIVPDPEKGEISAGKVTRSHLAGMGLELCRGALLTLAGLGLAALLARALTGVWPLSLLPTLALLALGASVPGGGLAASLGGWRRRWALFGAGFALFLFGGLLL